MLYIAIFLEMLLLFFVAIMMHLSYKDNFLGTFLIMTMVFTTILFFIIYTLFAYN